MENRKVLEALLRIFDKFEKEDWLAESDGNAARVSRKGVGLSFGYDFDQAGSYAVNLSLPDGKRAIYEIGRPPAAILGWAAEAELRKRIADLEAFIRPEIRRRARENAKLSMKNH